MISVAGEEDPRGICLGLAVASRRVHNSGAEVTLSSSLSASRDVEHAAPSKF